MKSKYPNQIDTSSELPIVRDNITEISSDVINSLRSAIVQIEKTLGVNPQGDIGQTVGGRISSVIDSSGNLRPEAVDKAGIVSGPIFDDQVSDVAAIAEHKLKLNFPTQVLQSQVSSLSSLISGIQSEIDVIASKISAHISLEATNRHKAKAITVETILKVGSSDGIKTFSGDNLQNSLKSLVEGHFNYDGVLINPDNNSHSADQIYFDNSNVSSAVESNSVHGALEELALGSDVAIKRNLSYITKNGLARFGNTNDARLSQSLGEILVDSTLVSFSSSGSSISSIFFDSTPTPTKEISKFDILTISGAISDLDNTSYQIYEVITGGGGEVTEVKIYGRLYSSSSGSASVKVTKNNFKNLNINGLNTIPRMRSGYSNNPDILVANPNSATVVSFGLKPYLLTATEDSFKIKIEDYSEVTISCYNSAVSATKQSLDSIIDKINQTFIANHMSAMAYKVRTSIGYELAISHTVPNFTGDIKKRSITISRADSNDGLSILGLEHVEDIEQIGSYGNSLFINGKIFRGYNKILTFDNTEVIFGSGSLRLTSLASEFLNYDIRPGDIVAIAGSSDSADDGTFFVRSVTAAELLLDSYSYSFSGALQNSGSITIIRGSVPVSELNFEEVDPSVGLAMLDIFATEDQNFFYSKRLEISNFLTSAGFYASIIDVSKDFILTGESYTLKITTAGMAYLETTGSTITAGEQTLVSGGSAGVERDDIFKIKSPDGASYISIRATSTTAPSSELSCTIYGGSEVSRDNLHLSRCIFSSATGSIFGTSGSGGIPSVIDKRNFGTIDIEQICPSFIEKNIEGPRNELRAAGIISGCEVSNVAISSDSGGSYITFDVSSGVVYSNGIRHFFYGIIGYKTYNPYVFICINEIGELEVQNPVFNSGILISPFLNRSVAYLSLISAILSIQNIDLRFFINELDKKINYNIIVSKDISTGHFTDIRKALIYCKFFDKVNKGSIDDYYRYSPSILIREGEYTIESPIYIDSDITITGSGQNTILKRGSSISNPWSFNVPDPNTAIFIIGDGPGVGSPSNYYSKFYTGVLLKNFRYESSDITTGGNTCFCLFQGNDPYATTRYGVQFVFDGISAIGSSIRTTSASTKEYFIFCGRVNKTTGIETSLINTSGLMIRSNYLVRMGCYNSGTPYNENIAVEFSGQVGTVLTGITVKDIVCTGNIATGVAPTDSAGTASILRYQLTGGTLSGIIEASNVVRTTV